MVASSRCSLRLQRANTADDTPLFPDLLFRVAINGVTDALFVLIEIDELSHVVYAPSCEAARIQRIAFDAPAIPPHAHLLVVRFSTAQLRGDANVTLIDRANAVTDAIIAFVSHRTTSSSSSSPTGPRASVLFAYYPLEAQPHIDAIADRTDSGVMLLPPLHCGHALGEPMSASASVDLDDVDALVARNESSYARTITSKSKRCSDAAVSKPKRTKK